MLINPAENPHLIRAYKDYMKARDMVRRGYLGNCAAQRDHLRSVYRFITGKV